MVTIVVTLRSKGLPTAGANAHHLRCHHQNCEMTQTKSQGATERMAMVLQILREPDKLPTAHQAAFESVPESQMAGQRCFAFSSRQMDSQHKHSYP